MYEESCIFVTQKTRINCDTQKHEHAIREKKTKQNILE